MESSRILAVDTAEEQMKMLEVLKEQKKSVRANQESGGLQASKEVDRAIVEPCHCQATQNRTTKSDAQGSGVSKARPLPPGALRQLCSPAVHKTLTKNTKVIKRGAVYP
ncbi:hypothetical protein NQZ68_032948 [Dissostichus eleginoides]|nr:hypothetical protein NQZ68_032948 [Dissostichus eleginoides]